MPMSSLIVLLQSAEETLLDAARELLQQRQFGPAVVVAQTACEVELEAALSELLQKKGLEPALADWIRRNRGQNYSPANDRVRELWAALTADDLTKVDVWPDYKRLVALRHEFVHAGEPISEDDGRAFFAVVVKLVQHISGVAATNSAGAA
jgi:hypothetical protein